jgi:type VI secretion system FHA domain protein
MVLTLEITGPEAVKLGKTSRKVFNARGGTIGRVITNDWVLPDGYVSSRHARIQYEDDTYYLVDESKNGVCINSPDNHLEPGRPYALQTGDWILIDPYEIHVSIAEEETAREIPVLSRPLDTPPQRAVPSPIDPFADGSSGDYPRPRPSSGGAPGAGVGFELLPAEEVDPLNLLGGSKRPPAHQTPRAVDLAGGSVINEHYRAPVIPAQPAAQPPAGLIPDDYDPLAAEDRSAVRPAPLSARARPAPPPSAPPSPPLSRPEADIARGRAPIGDQPVLTKPSERVPAARGRTAPPAGAGAEGARRPEGSLADVLAGAGFEGVAITPELSRAFGQIFRVVVEGVMDVLQARQRLKDEFRIGVTTFRHTDNNPLKFSANVEDALHNLLVKRNAAYLGPVDAFEDAFDDLRHHQMAMLVGMRAAFEAMVAQFEPDRLQETFDRQLKTGGFVPMPAKMRYWEMYRSRFEDIAKDPERNFRDLFGRVFGKTYEEQLARLKGESPKREGNARGR